ncbi:MFS transporter [Pseudofrankia inefficax]|uniref:Major facilitator superfamily MFS_1 n=1 Tax=Pseudofrankia inefficax (strain DSM 45817 / CECT 9037 / DDB 130130 / EuI1c) TaxID=298654 RepID=E3JAD7_PSEI1|nr:MFS transporter [Pseudofrankia inefficax]ADP80988.1 major facilitator superfamily MFS_1 [Pseudofrankia inefficax]
MASVYRRALTTQGATRFVLAAFVGRIPISMLGIGTILYIQHETGSYGVGGTVVAAATLGEALSAARIGRALDRFGQARVLVLCLLGHLVGLVGLLVTVGTGAPRPLWYVFAAVMGGVFPPTGSCSRARWSVCLTDGDLLGAAFSLEAAVDEVIFITGPVLATVLATAVAPAAGLVAAGILLTAGTLALAAQLGTDPGPRPATAGRAPRPRVFRDPALRALLLVLLAIGVSFGATDVTTVAFGRQHGLGAFSGVLLALFALGSATSGLFWGARPAGAAFARRFLIACGFMAFALWLPLAAPNVALLVPLVVITGATVAPSMVGANTVMERLVPPAARTEGFAWLQVALVTGISAGAPAAGATIDRFGARSGWAVAACAGVLVGLAALGGRRALLGAPAADGPARPAGPEAVAVSRSEMSGERA